MSPARKRKPIAKPKMIPTDDGEEVTRTEWLHQQVVKGVETLASEGGWRAFLQMKARMPRYSFGNTMAILMQDPDATMVAPYSIWTKKFKRQVLSVKDGGQPLYIFAPHTRWVTEVNEKTGQEERVKKLGFHATHTFDVKSTTGPELPQPPTYSELHGDAPQPLWDALLALVAHEGYVVDLEELPAGLHGDTAPNGLVRVNQTLSRLAQTATLLHEGPGHIKNRHIEDIENYHGHRGRFEVEAESTAYIVGTALGLDLGTSSFEYIAGWSKSDTDLLVETGNKVCKTADEVLGFLLPELGLEPDAELGMEIEKEITS